MMNRMLVLLAAVTSSLIACVPPESVASANAQDPALAANREVNALASCSFPSTVPVNSGHVSGQAHTLFQNRFTCGAAVEICSGGGVSVLVNPVTVSFSAVYDYPATSVAGGGALYEGSCGGLFADQGTLSSAAMDNYYANVQAYITGATPFGKSRDSYKVALNWTDFGCPPGQYKPYWYLTVTYGNRVCWINSN